MKAAFYTTTESGKILEIRGIEQPVPKDKEVVLRVRAASVNPLDWRMKAQRPGVDVAGEIVAVGRAVTHRKDQSQIEVNISTSLIFQTTDLNSIARNRNLSAHSHFEDLRAGQIRQEYKLFNRFSGTTLGSERPPDLASQTSLFG